MTRPDIARYFTARTRWSRWEFAFWAAWLVLFFIPNSNLVLLSQILIWGLFALSLDLLLGYRGIPSLGHAAFFGIGAYTAGFLGKYGWTEPISGLSSPASWQASRDWPRVASCAACMGSDC